jgi:hypothetical protein
LSNTSTIWDSHDFIVRVYMSEIKTVFVSISLYWFILTAYSCIPYFEVYALVPVIIIICFQFKCIFWFLENVIFLFCLLSFRFPIFLI